MSQASCGRRRRVLKEALTLSENPSPALHMLSTLGDAEHLYIKVDMIVPLVCCFEGV